MWLNQSDSDALKKNPKRKTAGSFTDEFFRAEILTLRIIGFLDFVHLPVI
jgi:hypothetical protein